MAWGKAGSTTLTTTGDTITVSDTTSSYFNQTLSHVIQTTGNIRMATRVGNGSIDTGSNYANRSSENGGADGTATSQTYHKNSGSVASDMFTINYAVNIATEEKLFISNNVVRSTSGAGTAPQRMESVGKWANTSNQFDYIETVNDQGGDYTTDSNLTALGSDLTPAAAVPALGANIQIGSRYEETDTRKMYNLIEEKYEDDFSTDKGWVTQYSSKMAYNGSTEKLDPVKYENSNNGDNITIAKELDFTLDTKFVIRFVLDFSLFGNNPFITMGVSDKDSTVNADTAQDYLGIICHNGSTWSAQVKDNTELGTFTNIGQASYSGHQSNFGTDFYCELIRNEDSFTINIRTGSHTGTSVVTATTTISTIGTVSNLKYIKFGSYDGTSSAGYCTTTIDDLLVYNGVTSISSTPTKSWQEIGV